MKTTTFNGKISITLEGTATSEVYKNGEQTRKEVHSFDGLKVGVEAQNLKMEEITAAVEKAISAEEETQKQKKAWEDTGELVWNKIRKDLTHPDRSFRLRAARNLCKMVLSQGWDEDNEVEAIHWIGSHM